MKPQRQPTDTHTDTSPPPTRREAGFTLVELLVVLAILGLLIGVVAPQVMIDAGRYPTQQEGLGALVANPGIGKWEGPYLKSKGVPVDPWGHPYQYRMPGTDGRDYDLYSLVPDGTGTAASSQ